MIPVGHMIPAGQTIPVGHMIPAGQTIPVGHMIPAGHMIPVGHMIPASHMIPVGHMIPVVQTNQASKIWLSQHQTSKLINAGMFCCPKLTK